MSTKAAVTTRLLKKYYQFVTPLKEYLANILNSDGVDNESESVHLETRDDSSLYCELLNASYIAIKGKAAIANGRFKCFPVMTDMKEVIDQAQERLFKSGRSQNVITLGYRLASNDGDRGKRDMTRVGITNFFVNTVITTLQEPQWDLLLRRIGVDAMLHLLTDTSLFLSLPNGCFCQVTGEPIIHMIPAISQVEESCLQTQNDIPAIASQKRPLSDLPGQNNKARKRRKLNPTHGGQTPHSSTAPGVSKPSSADITFFRAKLFYARPNFIPHTKRIVVGLPLKHILNRLNPSHQSKVEVNSGDYVDPDAREQAANVRHLSKYIFPRQYNLFNPFRPSGRKDAYKFADYSDRESEIKARGACKTPKRLKDILPLIDRLLWRHGKTAYKPLMERVCPSKLQTTGNIDADSSMILEMMSERSIQLLSQAQGAGNISVDSSKGSIAPWGLSQESHVKMKPRFVEFSCSYVEVSRYVALATDAVIPKSFWGTRSNLDLVLQNVKLFICSRRYETLTLHRILQGVSTSACDWLFPPGGGAQKQSRVSVSDALKRRELLEEFIFWYFDSFVLPLLKTTFYITESSAYRNKILYFRQDDWATLCRPLIDRLVSGTFERIPDSEAIELLRQRKLGFSLVRLLPKDTGVRPIVNLRRRPAPKGSFAAERSINQILQAAFDILNYERANQSPLLGTSVFGPDDVYSKIKAFKAALPRDNNGDIPKLYFVKVDVQACFDSIDQTKLLHILRDLISEDMYMTQRYGQVSSSLGRPKRKYQRNAIPEGEHPHFLEYATELAAALRNTIFVDQVVYPMSKKRDILRLLEEHISENIVKIGNGYYRQIVGIPQGSILSALLCSFFYGDLEKKFGQYREDPHSALLRLIDDYLFVTTSKSKAVGFLDMMNKGHPEYGCFISKEKTLTNFDYDSQILNVVDPLQRCFPWCGYLFNMKDLSISVDYSRYNSCGIRSTLTVERGRRPGKSFILKMMQLAKAKAHVIFSDLDISSEHVVYLNIYQNFLLAAMKMRQYLREAVAVKRNTLFIRNTVQRAIAYCFSSMRNQAKRAARRYTVRFDVQKHAVSWLGNHAFYFIFGRYSHNYASLLKSLEWELSRPRYRRYSKRFRSLVKEGQCGLAEIRS